MLEWMGLLFVALIILGICIIARGPKYVGITEVVAACIVVLCVIGAMFCFIGYGCGVDVKMILNDGSTYEVKSATYYNGGDGERLDLQEINVATNETIGPEFLYWRAVGVSTVKKAGDIVIYQNGKIRHWVSPF